MIQGYGIGNHHPGYLPKRSYHDDKINGSKDSLAMTDFMFVDDTYLIHMTQTNETPERTAE